MIVTHNFEIYIFFLWCLIFPKEHIWLGWLPCFFFFFYYSCDRVRLSLFFYEIWSLHKLRLRSWYKWRFLLGHLKIYEFVNWRDDCNEITGEAFSGKRGLDFFLFLLLLQNDCRTHLILAFKRPSFWRGDVECRTGQRHDFDIGPEFLLFFNAPQIATTKITLK